jgi:hypothetical protein
VAPGNCGGRRLDLISGELALQGGGGGAAGFPAVAPGGACSPFLDLGGALPTLDHTAHVTPNLGPLYKRSKGPCCRCGGRPATGDLVCGLTCLPLSPPPPSSTPPLRGGAAPREKFWTFRHPIWAQP